MKSEAFFDMVARVGAAALIAVLVTGVTGFSVIWQVVNRQPVDLSGEWWVLQGGVIAWAFKETKETVAEVRARRLARVNGQPVPPAPPAA